MLIIRLKGKSEHNDRAGPARLNQVIEGHQRAMVERLRAADLAQINALIHGCFLECVKHSQVVLECEIDAASTEFSKVSGQFGRGTCQKVNWISRRVRRNQYNHIGRGIDQPLGKVSESSPGAGDGLEPISSNLRNKQWWMRRHTRENDPACHS